MNYSFLMSLITVSLPIVSYATTRNPFLPPAITSCQQYRTQLTQQITNWRYKGSMQINQQHVALLYEQTTNQWWLGHKNQQLSHTAWFITQLTPQKIQLTFTEHLF